MEMGIVGKRVFLASLAVAGALTVGCSGRLDDSRQPAGNTIANKTRISFDAAPQSKALSDAGVKTFAVGDKIAVAYTDTDGEKVKAVSAAVSSNIQKEGSRLPASAPVILAYVETSSSPAER